MWWWWVLTIKPVQSSDCIHQSVLGFNSIISKSYENPMSEVDELCREFNAKVIKVLLNFYFIVQGFFSENNALVLLIQRIHH